MDSGITGIDLHGVTSIANMAQHELHLNAYNLLDR